LSDSAQGAPVKQNPVWLIRLMPRTPVGLQLLIIYRGVKATFHRPSKEFSLTFNVIHVAGNQPSLELIKAVFAG
jgi:hypothetical protein